MWFWVFFCEKCLKAIIRLWKSSKVSAERANERQAEASINPERAKDNCREEQIKWVLN